MAEARDQVVSATRLLEPIEVAAADTVHAKDAQGLRQVGDVYEVPKGARCAYLVVDRSALRASARR